MAAGISSKTTTQACFKPWRLSSNPATRGDPQSPLRWTCLSTGQLADDLARARAMPSATRPSRPCWMTSVTACKPTARSRKGKTTPIATPSSSTSTGGCVPSRRTKQPVVSVDAKKKELVGDFRNPGREWQPRGQPEEVRAKDFPDKQLGKVIPEGVYDLNRNEGWVSVGIDHDTAEFAKASLRRWWQEMGMLAYPEAGRAVDHGGCGGQQRLPARLWKVAVQGLANDLGLRISVCHFPPGTSKWNKIEHRMFCHITKNWRGRPLVKSSDRGQFDRPHNNEGGLANPGGIGYQQISDGDQSIRRRISRSPNEKR